MKKYFISVLSVAVIAFGMASCSGKKAQNEAAQEDAAAAAGGMTKSALTAELKTSTIEFLQDVPDFEVPYRIASGEVTISVGNLNYMIPVTKATELTTPAQKACVFGMYLSDYNVLNAAGQPVTEVGNTLAQLATDLNITFLTDIVKQQVPADKTAFEAFYQKQQEQIITALADNDKIDVAVEMLAGATAQYACLIANPTLVVKGDATSAGLSERMEKRLSMLGEVTSDLSGYYPELATIGTTIAPLSEKVTSINSARENNAAITGIRDALLK